MFRILGIVLLTAAVAVPVRLLAGDGGIDPSFGVDGWATLSFDWGDTPSVVASRVAPDGKILVGGNVVIAGASGGREQRMYVARFNANGVVDTGFGSGGKVYIDFGDGNGSNQMHGLTLQADGSILVGGSVRAPEGSNSSSFAIARLTSAGVPDASFGSPSTPGQVLVDFDPAPAESSEARALTVQADGGIVVAGTAWGTTTSVAVARLDPDGTLDDNFNLTGKATFQFAGTPHRCPCDPWTSSHPPSAARAVALDAAGNILVAGYVSPQSGLAEIGVLRILPDGHLDTSFNGTGKKGIYLSYYGAWAEQIAIQPDGHIALSGSYDDLDTAQFAAARLDPDGAFDTSFNGDGVAVVPYHVGYGGGSYSLLLQGNGKLLLSGIANVREPFGIDGSGHVTDTSDPVDGCWVTLLRLLPNGMPDPAFGDNGQQTYESPLGTEAWPQGVLAGAQNGRPILAIGYDSDAGVQQINVTRLLDSSTDVAGDSVNAAGH